MELAFDYHGVNHFGWFYNIRHGSLNILEKIRANPGAYQGIPGIQELETFEGIPTPYVALHTAREQSLLRMRSRATDRGSELAGIRDRVFPIFRMATRYK